MTGWNALLLLATTALEPVPPTAPLEVPPAAEVMRIPPELQAQLQARVIRPANSPEQRLQRLVELVFQPDGLALQYDPEATLSVGEVWRQRRANCLSFSLLFVSLAREIGVEARLQEVGQVVTWYQDRGLLFNAGHVNVGMRVQGRHATLDLDRNVLYDRRGPRAISDQRALAHFYNNLGADRLAAHDPALARRYFEASLRMEPRFVPAWNNLGVLDSRGGDNVAATRDFDRALEIDRNHPSALSNASALFIRLDDTARAAPLQKRLAQVRKRDPLYQFMRGTEAEHAGDYALAVRYYRAAVGLHGNAHQFHFGLARAYFLNGNSRAAGREMEGARRLADTTGQRARYQAKLDSLRRLQARRSIH